MKKIYTKNYQLKVVNRIAAIAYHNKGVDEYKHSFTLYWFTNYIPGHPDGENVFHWRAQCFQTSPKKFGFDIPKELGCYSNRNKKMKDFEIDEKGRMVFFENR